MRMTETNDCAKLQLYFMSFRTPSLNSVSSDLYSLCSKKIWLTSFPIHPWNPCQCFGRSCCLRPLKHLSERRKHCSPGLDDAAELRRRKPSGICSTIHFSKGVNSRKQYSWENYARFLPAEILPKNRVRGGRDREASVLLRKELLKDSNYMNWRSCTEKFLEIIMLSQDNC